MTTRILHGTKRIARYLGLSPRQVRYLIDRDRLPTFKMGSTVCSTPDMLDGHIDDLAANGG